MCNVYDNVYMYTESMYLDTQYVYTGSMYLDTQYVYAENMYGPVICMFIYHLWMWGNNGGNSKHGSFRPSICKGSVMEAICTYVD